MDTKHVKLLHVEDNLAHRRLVGHYLQGMKDIAFDVFHADNEEAAVESFKANGIGLVLLDYHLSQGDGLSCLRRLREVDPLVPIIALSGMATPETASELIEVGADDYLSKQELNRESLAAALRSALSRVELMKLAPSKVRATPQFVQSEARFVKLAREFFRRYDPALAKEMDDFEAAAREEKLSLPRLEDLFTALCDELDAGPGAAGGAGVAAAKRLRPLLLDAVLRIFGNLPMSSR